MTTELDERWLELVKAGKAEWVLGMLGPDGFRVLTVRQDSRGFQVVSRGCGWTAPSLQSDFLPDWSDPATLGALVGQVRERWGRPNLVAYYAPLASGQGWYVGDRFCGDRDYPVVETPSDTEAEALLRALEAAP